MEPRKPIKNWAADDQPREKLLALGPDKLSHSELLAILIRNGTKNESALELGKKILDLSHNNLQELGRLSINELRKVRGIGAAKAVILAAALELGRRRQAGEVLQKTTVLNTKDIAGFLKEKLQDYHHELFCVVFLNQANKVLGFEVVSEGGITGTLVDARIILRKALEKRAIKLILCHNHPSGNLRPSSADEFLTQKISRAAETMDMKVLDHIIVSNSGYFSFANEGLL
jgi:DNA repair protein RadC